MQQTLSDVFGGGERKHTVLKNRDTLSADYAPNNILHREKETKQLASILAPTTRGQKTSNIFIYGKTGTGKTLITKQTLTELEKSSVNISVLYINCKMKNISDTEYRLLAELSRMLGRDVPVTGLPTDHIYKIFFDLLKSKKQNTILVLDEIDALIKKIGDGILYNLTRVNQDLGQTKLSLIGISNDISFMDGLDPRVKSSLSEEELVFPPYNATQIQDILSQRALHAFSAGSIETGVIQKCSALAAQEHGDARKALDLLRIAGELAEREGAKKVTAGHVDLAENKLDLDRVVEVVKTQPKQSQTVLAAIIKLVEKNQKNVQTGDIFSVYENICRSQGMKVLTQRRISDLVGELDMFGIINARVLSRGRHGRTREIRMQLAGPVVERIKNVLKTNGLL